MSEKDVSIEKVTQKKTVIETEVAFSNGYMAAIFRKPEKANPFTIGTPNADAWKKGHESGQGVVTFHTTSLHTRPSTSWLLHN